MMRQSFILLTLTISTALLLADGFGQDADVTADVEREFQSTVARLLDDQSARGEASRLKISYQLDAHAVEAALRKHVSKEDRRAPLTLIEAARVMRVVECSRMLADKIDVSGGGFETGAFRGYPAAITLAGFGSLGYPGIFARLGHPASERQLRLFALIFLTVDGKKLATFRLEEKLQEHVSKKHFLGEEHDRTKNLRRLCEIVRTIDFSKQENWPGRFD